MTDIQNGKKIRAIKGVVVNAYKETKDSWTLNIWVHPQDRQYKAGQFISINPHQFNELKDFIAYLEHKKNKKEPIRAYSLASSPHEEYVSITIKPEVYHPSDDFPPLLSPILASDFLLGREIEFMGYTGAYVIPQDLEATTKQIIHITAGSGVVPNFAIIKDELHTNKSPHIKHNLIIVNKTIKDIIYHQKLTELQNNFADRLTITHFLTQETNTNNWGSSYRQGRPALKDVQSLILDKEHTLFFACGPAITKWQKKQALALGLELKPRFMEWVDSVIEELQINKKKYFKEVYG